MRRFLYIYSLLIFGFALFIFTACDETNPITQPDTLDDAIERWETVNPDNYTVDIERICFCPPPKNYTMVVADGEIAQIIDTETGEIIEETAGYATIDELFAWLKKVDSDNPKKLDLEFHREMGYPTFIDYNQSDMIIDEEMLMRLENLRIE